MNRIYLALGVIGSVIAGFFGGWTQACQTLVIFMGIDYISGIAVAGIFKKSSKTKSGALSSKYCWQGLAKKIMTLIFVGIGYQVDLLIGTTYLKDCICIAFIANELISIIENAGLMGIPIPKVLSNAVDVLKVKAKEIDKMSKEDFISEVSREALSRGYKFPSAIIAQACVESGFGVSVLASKYHNYFGMKCGSSWTGSSVNMKTNEEINGSLISIKDNFRTYATMEDGIKGYFDFISKSRYDNLKSATSSRDYLEKIKADGYATSSAYVDTVYNAVQKYNLTRFDVTTVVDAGPNIATYNVGDNYILQANVNVRTAPSKYAALVTYKGLSNDGKKHDVNKNGALDKGTVITCKDIHIDGADIWLKCPSGWLCAVDNGKVLIK